VLEGCLLIFLLRMVDVNQKAPSLLFYIQKRPCGILGKGIVSRRRVSHPELLFNHHLLRELSSKYDS